MAGTLDRRRAVRRPHRPGMDSGGEQGGATSPGLGRGRGHSRCRLADRGLGTGQRGRPCAHSLETSAMNALHRFFWLALVTLFVRVEWTAAGEKYTIPAAKKNHWAWKPPVRPLLPSVKDNEWANNPIDLFVLAKLEAAGL